MNGIPDLNGWHDDSASAESVPHHPFGIKPSGNGLGQSQTIRHSLGQFIVLPDELIIALLEYVDSADLLRLGASCKWLYAFSRTEELWKSLFIEKCPENFTWHGSWYSTYVNQPSILANIDCTGLFSDTLYRPFHCAHISLFPYTENIPATNQIPRLSDLTFADFEHAWTDQPFILTEPVKRWAVYRDWSIDPLVRRYGDVVFRAEAVDWPLKTYVDYMKTNTDESPLYLFDRSFVAKMGLSAGRTASQTPEGRNDVREDLPPFQPPACFGEDLFGVLGSQRPDSQWLIIGPTRSGSTFHKDPNATSAWNAVVRGSKYWIIFPPTKAPPGVYVSVDQSEVTSPLSIAEWLLNFHAVARQTSGCREGICGEGEVLHVPSGWWHLVVNLDTSIAITQNFVPRKHLVAALEFLKNKHDQVSGFSKDVDDPYLLLVDKMKIAHPDILEAALKQMDAQKKRKWDDIVHGNGQKGDDDGNPSQQQFSFGFGDDDSDAEVP